MPHLNGLLPGDVNVCVLRIAFHVAGDGSCECVEETTY